MTQKESPIFSKIEYNEAVEIKKDILDIQINLLNSLKKLSAYKESRKKEFVYKLKAKNKLTEIKKEMKNLFDTLPEIEQPEPEKKERKKNKGIEGELKEIKEKLKTLQTR